MVRRCDLVTDDDVMVGAESVLTSELFLLDLLDFTDVLFFLLLDFRDGCSRKHTHTHTLVYVCVSVGVSVSVYLWTADSDDPGWRDDNCCVSSQRTRLLDLLQHEAGHLVMVLRGRTEEDRGGPIKRQ